MIPELPESFAAWMVCLAAVLWTLKTSLDIWRYHLKTPEDVPPLYIQFAAKADTDKALERMAIRIEAVNKELNDKIEAAAVVNSTRRGVLHGEIGDVARTVSRHQGLLEHLQPPRK